jgi:hypothetical protein
VTARRFDGERAYVTRGGAWMGELRASWPTVELALDSASAQLRSRPGGLFDAVAVDRASVTSIVLRRGQLGTGISFHDHDADDDAGGDDAVVFWPTDAGDVLEALRERGWPVDLPA